MATDYRKLYRPDHPRADVLGLVGEHIIQTEKKLSRPLVKGEIVHHVDFHKPNNDEDNLKVLSRTQHQQLPAFQAVFILEMGLMDQFWEWWEDRKDNLKTDIQLVEQRLVQLDNKITVKNRPKKRKNKIKSK